MGTRVSSHVVKRHSPPRSAEVKNEWSYTSAPPIRLHVVERDNFTSEDKRCSKSSRKKGDVLLVPGLLSEAVMSPVQTQFQLGSAAG